MPTATRSRADPFAAWFAALEERHLSNLTFAELRRALQALSALYVERRSRLASGAALDGAGKRVAFALFYGPLHFLLVREIVRSVGANGERLERILDLGCGTGAAGLAWALECGREVRLEGIDRDAWAVAEAVWTSRTLGLRGRPRRGDLSRIPLPGRAAGILLAFTANELEPPAREKLRERLLEAGHRGARILVVEPISHRAAPWWDGWSASFAAAGGRCDRWSFAVELPERLRLLDRAAGLNHAELKGRSLWLSFS